MKYHIITLGCQMNISDSERVRSVFDELGYTWTDSEEEATLVGILACSVRQKAIDKVYSKISRWNKAKNNRNLITFISGCLLPNDKLKFLKLFDIVFQMGELPKLPDLIKEYGIVTPASLQGHGNLKANNNLGQFWDIKPQYNSTYEAFVPIQNGCDKFCTFCAVPYTRGREVSRPSQDIIGEVRGLVEQGYKSITLLGQNVNSYGLDKKGEELSFAQLLEEIGKIGKKSDNEFWLYYTSPHPRDMTEDVIKIMAKYDCIANQVHLPLQSGDDKVLIKMNRKHSLENYRGIVKSIRTYLPNAALFTDIIVGFSGETEEQFENTRKAVEEFKYNMAYIAMYSPRPGAASSRWEDDVPIEEKKRRFHRLTEELALHSEEQNRKLVGEIIKVLVTAKNKKQGNLSGLTEGKLVVRFPSENERLIGAFVQMRVTSATAFSIEGELVSEK